jgi:hypothetical protein
VPRWPRANSRIAFNVGMVTRSSVTSGRANLQEALRRQGLRQRAAVATRSCERVAAWRQRGGTLCAKSE